MGHGCGQHGCQVVGGEGQDLVDALGDDDGGRAEKLHAKAGSCRGCRGLRILARERANTRSRCKMQKMRPPLSSFPPSLPRWLPAPVRESAALRGYAGQVGFTDSSCPAGTKPQRRVSTQAPISVLPDPQGEDRAARSARHGRPAPARRAAACGTQRCRDHRRPRRPAANSDAALGRRPGQ